MQTLENYNKEIESLKKADDYPLRELLSRQIQEIIKLSDEGEIAIVDFTIEIRMIIDKGAWLANEYFPKGEDFYKIKNKENL